jgi:hypothetical protein
MGFNLDDGTTCNLPGTDLESVEPKLGPLANNGGPTQTHLPLASSPLINAVTAGCPPPVADQRGTLRVQGAGCEIGAVELTPQDVDADGDGRTNDLDNCPNAANPDQADADGDGPGDACDPDDDNDSVADDADNCPNLANQVQADLDGDGQGDDCDADEDGDGVVDASDNCAGTAASDQADADADGQGNACDPDDDNDGVADGADSCAKASSSDPSGCPAVTRTLKLSYNQKRKRLKGRLRPPSAECADIPVEVLKRKRGPDPLVGKATPKPDGRFQLTKKVKRGVYYAAVDGRTVPDVAVCKAVTSGKLVIR